MHRANKHDSIGRPEYSGVDNLEIMEAATNYRKYLLDRIKMNLINSDHILDFGAGIGTFVTPLRKEGFDVSCVENDSNLFQKLSKHGFKTFKDLNSVQNNSYDYIYSLNVLEHIADDHSILEKLFKILRPNGRFYLFVPAFNLLYSSMDRKVGHFRRYIKPDLVLKLKNVGFTVEEANYVDSLGFIVSLVFKFIGNKNGDLDTFTIKLYDGLVFPISRVFDKMCNRRIGKNLELLASKPS